MNCQNCGKPLNPGETFCTNCGSAVTPVAQPMPNPNVQPQPQPQPVPNQGVQNMAGQYVNNPVQPTIQPQQPQYGVNPEPPKKNTTFIIIAAALGVIIIGLVLFLIFRNKGDEDYGNVGGGGGEIEPSSQKTTPTPVSDNATKYAGYEFVIPSKYTVEGEDGGVLDILDYTNQVSIGMMVTGEYTYSDVISSKEEFLSTYRSIGISITSSNERSLGGKTWFIVDGTINGGYARIAHTAIGNKLCMILLSAKSNSAYDTIVTDFGSIVSSAKTNDVSGFTGPNENEKLEVTVKKVFNK